MKQTLKQIVASIISSGDFNKTRPDLVIHAMKIGALIADYFKSHPKSDKVYNELSHMRHAAAAATSRISYADAPPFVDFAGIIFQYYNIGVVHAGTGMWFFNIGRFNKAYVPSFGMLYDSIKDDTMLTIVDRSPDVADEEDEDDDEDDEDEDDVVPCKRPIVSKQPVVEDFDEDDDDDDEEIPRKPKAMFPPDNLGILAAALESLSARMTSLESYVKNVAVTKE